ncbi:uncharacterized protein [Littorina saxatilis]|uniref:Thioredoxin domain-containing protein n=1 Tax=Littorina saxatilis TaxID=31220 RepID=A0AAN9C002_9CAEN
MKCHLTYIYRTLLILANFVLSFAEVFELNKDNLETFRKGKLLVVIFVDSPTCTRCRIQFPFFVATSQAFPSDPEVFFARVHDPRLVQEWGITELPALIYYRDGIEEPDFFPVDVTVDDIIDEIARRLHGNFGGLERFYAVEVTSNNFREIVKTPKQSVLLLTYDKNSLEEVKVMEQVAKVYRNDDAILICKLNVDKEMELRDKEFKSRDVPAVFWYSADEKKTPKRFGGHISIYMETTFINEQTGLNRNPDGSMKPTSGRIDQYDNRVLEFADGLLEGDKEVMGRIVSHLLIEKAQLTRHENEFANYYIFLLDKIRATGKMDIVNSQLEDIAQKLDQHEDMTAKQEDTLKRKRNILGFFKNLPDENERMKQDRAERREREEMERQERELEEEEIRQKEEAEEKLRRATEPIRTKVVPKKKDAQRDEYTAQATIHRRAHEEL